MSLAKGIESGFGLMQSFYDSQSRRESASEQLELDRQKQEDTAAYRAEDLRIKGETAEAEGEYQSKMADYQQARNLATISVQNATQIYNMAKLNWDKDPTNPENIKALAEATKSAAQANQEVRYNEEVGAASTMNDVYDMVRTGQPLSDEQNAFIAEAVKSTEGTAFALSQFDFNGDRMGNVIDTLYQDVMTAAQQGKNIEASPDQLRALTGALNLGASAARGRVVDPSFVNAPNWAKDGNWVVDRQGLQTLETVVDTETTSGAEPKEAGVKGSLYVLVKHRTTGEIRPYFAPLSPNRSTLDPKGITIDLNDGLKVAAGHVHMLQQLTGQMRPAVREALIKEKFSEPGKDASGVTKFNENVKKELEGMLRGLQGGNPGQFMYLMTAEEAQKMKQAGTLTMEDMEQYRNRVEDNMLFGSTAVPDQQLVNEWITGTRQKLASTQIPAIPETDRQSGFKYIGGVPEEGGKNLGSLVNLNDVADSQLAELSGFYDEQGKIENVGALLDWFKETQYLVNE